MKKVLNFLILIISFFYLSNAVVLGSGCFHDKIHVVNKAGVITRGANVRDVACMYGSKVIATLRAGTKVRIIGQTAWTKIVMPDGRVGRVGNNFVREDSNRANVPAMPNGHKVDSYCDTTNPKRCPNPSPKGATPTFYYLDNAPTSNYVPEPQTYEKTIVNQPKSDTSKTSGLKSLHKTMLDGLAERFVEKLENKYSSLDDQIEKLEEIIEKIGILEKDSRMKDFAVYLKEILMEYLSMKKMAKVLDI